MLALQLAGGEWWTVRRMRQVWESSSNVVERAGRPFQCRQEGGKVSRQSTRGLLAVMRRCEHLEGGGTD